MAAAIRIAMANNTESPPGRSNAESLRVLLFIEDPVLTEVLTEALEEDGHRVEHAEELSAARRILLAGGFDAAIVDLDTRARSGADYVALVRQRLPSAMVIVLLPCGGTPVSSTSLHYHLAIEKPARLAAVRAALLVGRSVSSN